MSLVAPEGVPRRRNPRGARGSRPQPLAVDLDHTLARTDTLLEALLVLALHRPFALLKVMWALARGRAAFKAAVTRAAPCEDGHLVYDERILDFIRRRRAAGGEVYLITAADQHVADAVASRLGLFDGALGSDGVHNLKGPAKAAALCARFRQGFAYLGDSCADVAVWRRADEILLAGGGRKVRSRLAELGLAPSETFPRPAATLRDWLRALRLHQWSKNALVLIPLFLGQAFDDAVMVARTLLACLAFCVLASGTYLLNDLADLAADRAHPSKQRRPIAAGVIPLHHAIAAMVLLVFVGLVGAFVLQFAFGLIAAAYLITTATYSLKLKTQPLIDVMTIGGLFAGRIMAGTVIAEQPASLWLTSFTMILFTSLALAKRHAEVVRAAAAGRVIAGRGYLADDAPLTVSLGIASAMTSVLVMLLYMQLEAAETGLYAWVEPLMLVPAVLAAWLVRIWVRAHRGVLQDDPVTFALKDRVSWAHALLVAGLWAVAAI